MQQFTDVSNCYIIIFKLIIFIWFLVDVLLLWGKPLYHYYSKSLKKLLKTTSNFILYEKLVLNY